MRKLLMVCSIFGLAAALGGCGLLAGQETPAALVESFLALEQRGDYGSAWEKLHPEIRQRWPKEAYIQQRAKMFMDVLGAQPFVYETGEAQTLADWASPLSGTTYADVVLVPTKLTFTSSFGTMSLLQNYYVVRNDGQLHILWDIPPDKAEAVPDGGGHGVTSPNSQRSS